MSKKEQKNETPVEQNYLQINEDVYQNLETGEYTVPALRHSMNYVPTGQDLEYIDPDSVSLTVPDQTMTVSEIFQRFAGGRPIDLSQREPVFHGDDIMIPDIRKLDLVEIGERLDAVRENRELLEEQLKTEQEIANQLEAEKAAKEKAEENERLYQEYEKRQKANEK